MKYPSPRQLLQALLACSLVVGGSGVALTVGETTFDPQPQICAPPQIVPWKTEPLLFSEPAAQRIELPAPHGARLAGYNESVAKPSNPPARLETPPAQRLEPVVQYSAEHSREIEDEPARIALTPASANEPLPAPNGPEVVPVPSGVVEPYTIIEEVYPPQYTDGFTFGPGLPPLYDDQPIQYVGPKPLPNEVVAHAMHALDAECARTRCDIPTIGKERVPFALFSIDAARPQDAFSTRFDFASGINRPDRAEYYWSQIGSGGPPSPETNLDYLEMRVYSETKVGQSAGFFEIPLRFLNPEVNNNTTGFSNLTFGTKSVIFEQEGLFGLPTPSNDYDRFQVSSVFKTHISLGSPLTGRGLVNGSIALQPGMLANYEVSPRTFFHGEATYWIPLGGSDFSGNFVQCGVGISHVLHSSLLAACPADSFAIIPTFEVVGTRFTTGLQTMPDGTTQEASNSLIINLEPGVRMVVGNHMEIGGSFARNITNTHLFKNLGRVEFRWFW